MKSVASGTDSRNPWRVNGKTQVAVNLTIIPYRRSFMCNAPCSCSRRFLRILFDHPPDPLPGQESRVHPAPWGLRLSSSAALFHQQTVGQSRCFGIVEGHPVRQAHGGTQTPGPENRDTPLFQQPARGQPDRETRRHGHRGNRTLFLTTDMDRCRELGALRTHTGRQPQSVRSHWRRHSRILTTPSSVSPLHTSTASVVGYHKTPVGHHNGDQRSPGVSDYLASMTSQR